MRTEDLVLRVSPDYDPTLIDLDAYEGFLDALCGDREFQKRAIRSTCRFLAGGEYGSTRALAEENYAHNGVLVDRYRSSEQFALALPFPNKRACSLDLATGTGKSFVLYGIARILLAEGVVDRVLLLCPSLTIEAGLRVKFRALSSDPSLLSLIPSNAAFRVPEITDANSTTGPGSICIENIDATYKHVRSSVRDSFRGRGGSTLVLNDEAHHIYSPVGRGDAPIKRWKEFLDNPEFGFDKIVGVSGTCYVGNTYFPDVIERYSLHQAMEDARVKLVDYVAKDDSSSEDERFQKYLKVHRENQKRYLSVKPLSIIVTATISAADSLANRFTRFLSEETGLPLQTAEKAVLVVTSKKEHAGNVAKLALVDRPDSPVEWIISVSMLTEGWDVQNVFQVVPHEKRAFDSKLLIAQVLGRGLRVPAGITGSVLKVFNHASWSSEIANLVREVLDQDRRLRSYPVMTGAHAQKHFELHQLSYDAVTRVTDLLPRAGDDGQVNLFIRGLVQLESQSASLERETLFVRATTQQQTSVRTQVHYVEHDLEVVVRNMHGKLRAVDIETGSRYSREYPPSRLQEIVEASLANIQESRRKVSEQNLQRLLRAMGNVRRDVARTVRVELNPRALSLLSTTSLRASSFALASFMHDATVFYDSESWVTGEDADTTVLKEIVGDDSSYPKRADKLVANKYFFKSPVNVVLTSHSPEREFVARLFEADVAAHLDSWVKSSNTGFYEIGYSWRRGDHTKQGVFNPDLFLRLKGGSVVLVVELKDDDDLSDENKAKLKFASDHFTRINNAQGDVKYFMKFFSPTSYDAFFDALKRGEAASFVSSIQANLA